MSREYYDMMEEGEFIGEGELQEEEFEDWEERLGEIPNVYWAEDIAAIENEEMREMAIEDAERIVEMKDQLDARLEEGALDQLHYEDAVNFEIRPEQRKASTRALMASENLLGDHIGEVPEQEAMLIKAASTGDTRLLDLNQELESTVDRLGSDRAQELADEMYEDGRLGEEAYQIISRKARLARFQD